MEKEMKKLLLVAVSVGVFLLLTITISIIILTPKTQPQDASVSSYSQGRVQPAADYTPAVIIPQETTPVAENSGQPAVDTNNGDNLTIQIPVPSTVSVSDTPVTSAPVRVATTPAAPSASTVTAAPAPAASSSASASTTTAAATAPARPAAVRTVTDYWIQVGAYRAMVRAEDVRESLADKGLLSIIENRQIGGDNLYRVRLGPYTSKREANHWLAIVQSIDGFSDSQVRETTRQQ